MSRALDKYNDRKEFEIPSGIKTKKISLGEISFKVKPTMSKDEVIRGLRMMVVESGEKRGEWSQEYDYNKIRSLSGGMKKEDE